MTQTFETVLMLLRSALFGAPLAVQEQTDWEAVCQELEQQASVAIASNLLPELPLPQELRKRWQLLSFRHVGRYFGILNVQKRLCALLRENGIRFAVLKGTAAAIYYPEPSLRTMGDIDLIAVPEDFEAAFCLLRDNGCRPLQEYDETSRHLAFKKDGVEIELHRSFANFSDEEMTERFAELLISSIGQCVWRELSGAEFPMLPQTVNGLVLLSHLSQHVFLTGVGLRQVCDWLLFVNASLDDAAWNAGFGEAVRSIGMEKFAKIVTRMGQKYLGLQEKTITWCKDVDEPLCDALLEIILQRGNFGSKEGDSTKTLALLQRSRDLPRFLRYLQRSGCSNWKAAQKHSVLKPFAWAYQLCRYAKLTAKRHKSVGALISEARTGREYADLFQALELPLRKSQE